LIGLRCWSVDWLIDEYMYIYTLKNGAKALKVVNWLVIIGEPL